MYSIIVKRLSKAALVILGMGTLNVVAATVNAPKNYQVIEGVAIYLGVMPAQIVRGHDRGHVESKMHGGIPSSRDSEHVVVALFDNTSGKRIENAKVSAQVMELGLGPEWKNLEPMRIAGTITYGNYFDMPQNDIYHIQVRIHLADRPNPLVATFTYQH